jgi:hypothetical protein
MPPAPPRPAHALMHHAAPCACTVDRESRLLIDEKDTPLASKIACTRTVCHELAHMWFGNLVTMEWWTHLWLNEGFARFMEFKAVHHIFPEWDMWLLFVQSVQGAALRLDATTNTHPIQVPVSKVRPCAASTCGCTSAPPSTKGCKGERFASPLTSTPLLPCPLFAIVPLALTHTRTHSLAPPRPFTYQTPTQPFQLHASTL